MKRFWLLVLLMAGSLVALHIPAFADDDSTDSVEDVNQALGSLKNQLTTIQKSVSDIGLYGDVRLKYGWQTQSSATSGDVITDQDKFQVRARLGIKKTFGDVEANVRLVTDASSTYPNSNTPTLGDGLSDLPVYFDTISIAWTPSFLNKQVKVGGGKFQNVLDYTPITWDDTLTQDGGYVQLMTGGTKLTSVYIDLDSPQGAAAGTAGTAAVTEGPAPTTPGGTNDVDAYIWTTQLSQDLALDKTSNLHLMVGYEYIPYVTQLQSVLMDNGKSLTTDGMILNYGSSIPDIQMVEFLATYKSQLFADVPWKWTLHLTDNLDSFNVPTSYVLNGTAPGASNAPGYTQLSNSVGGWLSVDFGDSSKPAKDAFGGQLAFGYLEPNAQLSMLTDHDANFTNSEYFRGILTFGLENNVALQYKTWVDYHVYYDSGIADVTTAVKLDGSSQTPEWINFFYCTASF